MAILVQQFKEIYVMLLNNLGINRITMFLLLIIFSIIINSCSTTSTLSKIKVGAITGIVQATENIEDGIKSNVLLINTELGCTTGKDGKFLLLDVPIGIYKIRASCVRFHNAEYYNVRVAEDSITVLRFDMLPDLYQMEPMPRFWEEKYKEMFELKDFLIQGKLFDLE
jgi:hypothetical protein